MYFIEDESKHKNLISNSEVENWNVRRLSLKKGISLDFKLPITFCIDSQNIKYYERKDIKSKFNCL